MGVIESFARGWFEAGQRYGRLAAPAEEGPVGDPDSTPEFMPDHSAEQAEAQATIAELQELLGMQKARGDLFGELLLLPGIKAALAKAFSPDSHPSASPDDRREFEDIMKKINSAYDLLKVGSAAGL